MKKSIFVALSLLLATACGEEANQELLSIDFEKITPDVERILNSGEGERVGGIDGIEVVEGVGYNGSKGLVVTYIGEDIGSRRYVATIPLAQRCTEATLNFRVMFEDDFQFVKGGKLHGLGPKNRVTGGKDMHPEGWSTRIMFSKENTIVPYIYNQNKEGRFGISPKPDEHFIETGKFHDIAMYVKINSPVEQANGYYEIWLNGEMISSVDNLQLRTKESEESQIYDFLFSTFYGGRAPEWAPKNPDGSYATCHARFDDFLVTKGKYIRK
ncbi:MAG: polysaccharide lyase [Rikenellaceae bacterium]